MRAERERLAEARLQWLIWMADRDAVTTAADKDVVTTFMAPTAERDVQAATGGMAKITAAASATC